MTVNDIYSFLDDKYDFSSALAYDNVGLLVGGFDNTVTGIVVCLDCTDDAVSQAVENGANLLYRIGELGDGQSAYDLAESVSKKLKLPVKYVGQSNYIKRVAVCSGSGGGMLSDVINQGAHAYITADIKHNVFMEGYAKGITVIDAGHFNTEDIIVPVLANALKEAFPQLKVLENHFSPIKYSV